MYLGAIVDGTLPWVERRRVEASSGLSAADNTGRGCRLFITWNLLDDLTGRVR